MWKWPLILPGLALAAAASAQVASPDVEVANLREDVRGLSQRVAELSLKVERLEAENTQLKEGSRAPAEAYATVAQLNSAVAQLNGAIQAKVAESKDDTLRQVAAQIEKLGRQTNAALDALGGHAAPAAHPAGTIFTDTFPKEGVSYTVQKGDTLALIAKKTGGKVQEIINANKITDPARIYAGQSLFIPGGK